MKAVSTKASVSLAAKSGAGGAAGFALTATDIAAVVISILLTISVLRRIKKSKLNNPGLLRANIAMVVVIVLSISVVFDLIDPLLGGRSALNALTHLLMVYVGWEIVATMANFMERFDFREKRSILIHPIVPIVGAAGVVVSYLVLNPGSSRGLDNYDDHPAYVIYWMMTLLPLLLGAAHLVPRMARVAPKLLGAQWVTAVSMCLLWCSLVGVALSAVFYFLTAINQDLWLAREIVVTSTVLAFTLAFLLATAVLPRSTRRRSQRLSREEIQTGPQ